jgi:hypothetical protein
MPEQPNVKLCECGCGRPTPIALRKRRGYMKGEPMRFVHGHASRAFSTETWARINGSRSGKRRRITTHPPPNPSGLCMCGCGQTTPLATWTDSRDGTVKGEHSRCVQGHKTTPMSQQTKTRISMAKKGRPVPLERRRRISITKGGTGQTKLSSIRRAIHTKVAREYPKRGACEECGVIGPTDMAFKRHPEPHTTNPADYRELCRLCHRRYDSWFR